MAVSVDTYDEENGIHPRYKQIIGERLAYTGLNVAYGLEEFPERGPQVAGVSISVSKKNHENKALFIFILGKRNGANPCL